MMPKGSPFIDQAIHSDSSALQVTILARVRLCAVVVHGREEHSMLKVICCCARLDLIRQAHISFLDLIENLAMPWMRAVLLLFFQVGDIHIFTPSLTSRNIPP